MASATVLIPRTILSLLGRRNRKFYTAALEIYWKALLKGYSIANADFIVGQCILESSWATSNISSVLDNVFGMQMPKSRPTLAISESCGHLDGEASVCYAKFQTITNCVEDRFMWDVEFSSVFGTRNNELYPAAVSAVYHGSSTYEGAVRNIVSIHKKELDTIKLCLIASTPLAVLAAYLLLK